MKRLNTQAVGIKEEEFYAKDKVFSIKPHQEIS